MKRISILFLIMNSLIGCINSNFESEKKVEPKEEKLITFTKMFWNKHRDEWIKNDILKFLYFYDICWQ